MNLKSNHVVRAAADFYNEMVGLPPVVKGHYVPVNKDRAREIAENYAALPTVSDDNWTRAAYTALLNELTLQWQIIERFGYTMEPWTRDGQPYQDSAEMREDVLVRNHLYFFTGGEPHPYLDSVVPETGYTGNEMLRAVHDIFGHAAEGYGFGARGEENAWIHHSMMFSPLAQWALTTETRGQNSWVNFGPNEDLPVTERPYAEQKVALLPEWCRDWREALHECREVPAREGAGEE